MLRLIDMDNTCPEQRLGVSMRQLEKLAYMCITPEGDYPTIKRLADKMASMSEHTIAALEAAERGEDG